MAKPKKAVDALIDLFTPKGKSEGALPSTRTTRMGDVGFDPRYDERIKEQDKLNNLTTKVEERPLQYMDELYLPDYEGEGFVSSMSDRTAAGGMLVDINGVPLNRPIDLRGGQDYMFDNDGQVWASAEEPVRAIMMQAAAAKALTGKDPLYLPWRMAPTGGDFAHMTGETMLSFAESNMGKGDKRSLNSQIKKFIPDWKGIDSPESFDQYRTLPDAERKALKAVLDKNFRERGGLGIGEARLAVSDPSQLNAPEGYLMNVGRIFADKPMIEASGHPSYPKGVPGEGLGRLSDDRSLFELNPRVFPPEKDIRALLADPSTARTAYENLPDVNTARGIADPRNPSFNDTRALQMKPYYGILTDKLLRQMGYAEGGMVESPAQEAIANTVQNPNAARMLNMDLANLALMQQPQRMKDGGVAKMQDGGFMSDVYKWAVPAHARTFVETLAGNQSPITEKNFSSSELEQMRDAIMRSRRDRMATNQRLHHEAMQAAPTEKERRELRMRGASPQLDQTVGYQHYPGSPTSLASDFDITSDAAIRNTLGRFAYEKDADGNLIATDMYKFRDDLSGKTRPSSDYANMSTGEKLWTLLKDSGGKELTTLPSRIGSAFLGNKEGRPVTVNLGKAPFAEGGLAKFPTPEEMLIELMERGYGKR
jgi:hypothetical protein